MRTLFIFRALESGGIFSLPVEFNANQKWKTFMRDVARMADEVAGERAEFLICHAPGAGASSACFHSARQVVAPILVEALRREIKIEFRGE